MKYKLAPLFLVVIFLFLSVSCNINPKQSTTQLDVSTEIESPTDTQTPQSDDTHDNSSKEVFQQTLFIGQHGNFKKFLVSFQEEPTFDDLVAKIAHLTDWDLTLAEPISVGKGGATVLFSKDSALFTGPPNPQKEQFHTYAVDDFVFTVLDSIAQTLQYNSFYNPEEVDTTMFPVFFGLPQGKPLYIEESRILIPMEEPYVFDSRVEYSNHFTEKNSLLFVFL